MIVLITANGDICVRIHRALEAHGLHSVVLDASAGTADPAWVVARVLAVVDRHSIAAGGIQVERTARTVRADGRTINLTTAEYEVLDRLTHAAGTVVPREELMRAACGREAAPLDRSLDVHISHLRRKLGRHAARLVTVRGVGYMLAAE